MKKLFLASLLSLVAVSGVRAQETSPPSTLGNQTVFASIPLSKYEPLIIRDFDIEGAKISNVPPEDADQVKRFNSIKAEMVKALTDDLIAKIKAKGIVKEVLSATEVTGTTKNAVILEGRFTAVDAGRRGLRMYIGFSGVAAASIEGRLLDASTGAVLASFSHSRSASLGMAGSKRVLLQVTDDLADDLAAFIGKLY